VLKKFALKLMPKHRRCFAHSLGYFIVAFWLLVFLRRFATPRKIDCVHTFTIKHFAERAVNETAKFYQKK